MPKSLHGKKLTGREHEIWQSAYDSASADPNVTNPGAVATAAVKKHRARGGKKKSFNKRKRT